MTHLTLSLKIMETNTLASIFFTGAEGNHSSIFKADVSFTNVKQLKDGIWGFFVYVPTLAYDSFDGFIQLYQGTELLCVRFQKWFCERVYQDGSFSVHEFEDSIAQGELFSDAKTQPTDKKSFVIELDNISSLG